jgi:hypothetical protein
VDESTGEGTGEGGDGGRAKGAMEVGDKAGKGKTGEGEVGCGVTDKGVGWSDR